MINLLNTLPTLTLEITIGISQADARKLLQDMKTIPKPSPQMQELQKILEKVRDANVQL